MIDALPDGLNVIDEKRGVAVALTQRTNSILIAVVRDTGEDVLLKLYNDNTWEQLTP